MFARLFQPTNLIVAGMLVAIFWLIVRGLALSREITEEDGAVDNLTIAKRLRMLRQEISELMALNRDYSTNNLGDALDTDVLDKRRQRLEEIKEELAALQRRSAA